MNALLHRYPVETKQVEVKGSILELPLPLTFGDALTADIAFLHVLQELPLQLKGYHEFGLPSLEVTCICLFLEECRSPIRCALSESVLSLSLYLLLKSIR